MGLFLLDQLDSLSCGHDLVDNDGSQNSAEDNDSRNYKLVNALFYLFID
jgi:hypothetical protein